MHSSSIFYAPLHVSIAPMRKTACVRHEISSCYYCSISAFAYCFLSFTCRNPLPNLIEETGKLKEVLPIKVKHHSMLYITVKFIDNDNDTEHPEKSSREKFDFNSYYDKSAMEGDNIRTLIVGCIAACFSSDHKIASKFIDTCKLLECFKNIHFLKPFKLNHSINKLFHY